MNRAIVLAEWARAKQSLRAAEILAREECAEDAISRAYYATLHAAKAALLIHEVVVESHAAVKRMSYPLGCRLGRSFAEGPRHRYDFVVFGAAPVGIARKLGTAAHRA